MYAQAAIKPNPLPRNGAYSIVMRGVHRYGVEFRSVMLYQIRHGNRNLTPNFDTMPCKRKCRKWLKTKAFSRFECSAERKVLLRRTLELK